MAIIQYTGIVNQIRGKLNGSVFNKAKNSYTLQRRQASRKGSTPAQSLRRRQFASVQRAYKSISQSEKEEAALAAINNPVFDRFGNLVVLSGYNHWVKTNLVRLQAGLQIVDAVDSTPAPTFGLSVESFSLSLAFFANGNLIVNTSLQSIVTVPNSSDLLTIVEIALPQSRGVSSPPHGFLRIGDNYDAQRYLPGQSFIKANNASVDFKYPVPGPDQVIPIRWQFWRPSSGSLIYEVLELVVPVVQVFN